MSLSPIDRIRTGRPVAATCLALALAVAPAILEAQSSTRRENGVTRAVRARAERAANQSGTRNETPTRLTSNAGSTARSAKTASAPASASAAPASSAPGTFDAFMRAMYDLPALSNKFVRIPALRPEHISLVDVRNVFRESSEQERFEAVLQEQDRRITGMRSTLQNSMTLRDVLYDRQLTMSQVVAVDVLPDGRGAVVYYRAD